MSQQQGYAFEKVAREYLTQQGLTWLTSNFRCRFGEIDLIMRDRGDLVFVEVRARRSLTHGSAAESVDGRKQQKLIRSALYYMQKYRCYDQHPCRFDVLCFQGDHPQRVDWIKRAFDA